jgi:hypothetical protein
MKLFPAAFAAVLASAIPLAGLAQQPAPPAAPPGGPSSQMRAQMLQARDNARNAALNDLSPDHRARVQGIIDQVNAGTQTDLRAAAQQIDAVLTPSESQAILGERDKMIASMHAQTSQQGAAGPSGQGGPAGPPHRARSNDAGRFLLMVGISPERMRALRGSRRGGPQQGAPAPYASPGAGESPSP